MFKLTEDEQFVLTHISRWGSDGYPIVSLKRGATKFWSWGPIRAVKGPPVLFKTKREAVASFEAYLDSLRDRFGEQRQAEAIAEIV